VPEAVAVDVEARVAALVEARRRTHKRYRALAIAVKHAGHKVAAGERLSSHSLRHTYTSHLIVGLELDAATTSKLAGHADLGEWAVPGSNRRPLACKAKLESLQTTTGQARRLPMDLDFVALASSHIDAPGQQSVVRVPVGLKAP
jgi:hypothetical protein